MKTYILLVDSNQSFRERVTAMLRDKGYAVFEAGNLQDASEILFRESIDLICVDGLVSGETTAHFASDLFASEDKLLVAYLAHPVSGTSEVTFDVDVQADVVMHRPISPEELVYKLDTRLKLKLLDEHRTRKEAATVDDPKERPSLRDMAEFTPKGLRKHYGAKVPALFAELGELLVIASEKRDSVAELQEAHRIAHMLNGTAGSVGFSDVSSAVHSLEAALKEMLRMRRLTSVPAQSPVPSNHPSDSIGATSDEGTSLLATVLVVDDDPDFLSTVKAMGRENLVNVKTVSSAREALAAVRETRVDAAIIDIILAKGEDAFAIARNIRALPGYRDLPLGFISVDSSVSQRIAAAHAGASIFLDKPLQSTEFVAAVRRLVPLEEPSRPKILVVDDDPDFLKTMVMLLESEGIEVVTLATAENIVDEMAVIRPDMVLLDVVMEKVNGMDACRVLRSTEMWRDTPILMLTVFGNRRMLVKCFECGADDYVEKPIIKEELLARIRLRLDRIQMYRERADIDVLTGLPTRRPFIELLKMRLAEGVRFNKPVALCLLDLDHFKRINDTYGHLAGDRVLSGLGLLLSSRFRTMDVRGRWGGEEFVVAFYGEDSDTAQMIVNRVLEELRQMVFNGDHGETFSVTFSAGVASFPSDGKNAEELFRQVDRNLYHAKEKGRNRIEIE
jgi:diguanylate cyclase (GGDEF)-like protein